jgi:FkbM family methyltransferase
MLYWFANLIFQSDFSREIKKILKNKNRLIIFDVGCYKGVFASEMINIFRDKIEYMYLFDINKKVKDYLKKLTKKKNIEYNELALINKSGTSVYNYNKFFESAGSSISNLVKKDKKWNFSRRILTGNYIKKNNGFSFYKVKTSTLDLFLKKNNLKYIDVCKVDIEGSEHEFLIGSKEALKRNKIKILSIEIMENKKNFFRKEKKILNLLKKFDFKLIKKKNIRSISFFSNLKGGDYLFLNNRYIKN